MAAVSPETVEIYARRGVPIVADPVATFDRLGRAAETWRTTAQDAGHDANARLAVLRTVYVAPTLEQAHEDQIRFEAQLDRTQFFNEQSAPIVSATGEFAEGFDFWQKRYMAGKELGPEFRWERIELIGDPERVISQIKTLESFGYSSIVCDFEGTHPATVEETKKVLELFAKEVIPAFR
jgi:alkanesulfonate monooxygenase SsuD/methylene tetrahydromethanopterin reductase-like flavin-dependent oxidoreductase (luciferase family)